jgi:hypothetical protein
MFKMHVLKRVVPPVAVAYKKHAKAACSGSGEVYLGSKAALLGSEAYYLRSKAALLGSKACFLVIKQRLFMITHSLNLHENCLLSFVTRARTLLCLKPVLSQLFY